MRVKLPQDLGPLLAPGSDNTNSGSVSGLSIRQHWRRTSWELRKAQNPEASAERMYTWPVSRRRMPRQTSASHILLYLHAFVIRVDLRRRCFWHFAFLLGTSRLGRVCGAATISK